MPGGGQRLWAGMLVRDAHSVRQTDATPAPKLERPASGGAPPGPPLSPAGLPGSPCGVGSLGSVLGAYRPTAWSRLPCLRCHGQQTGAHKVPRIEVRIFQVSASHRETRGQP